MNDESNYQESTDENARTMGAEGAEHEQDNFGAKAGENFKQGAADAARAVNDFMPKFRKAAEKSIFKGVYGVSFGANFAGKILKDVVVENVVKGAREGARAGRDAATQYRRRRQTAAEENVVDATEVAPGAAPA
ncbi:MAG: hypothetical protein AAGA58_19455 [Verrucomicrobiota bacterium]